MRADKIVDELNHLIEEEKMAQTVLFDGAWGCGKTYNINKFLEQKGDSNYIYISLFGAKTGDDIILRLAERLDSRFITTVNGHVFLIDSPKEKPFYGGLVIFDDLERKGADLSFETVFGIVDNLRRLGFAVICLISTEEIEWKELGAYIDKAFDRKIHISADASQLSKVVPQFANDSAEALLRLSKDNLRLLKKAESLLRTIISKMTEAGHPDFLNNALLDKTSFYRCLVMALRCTFSINAQAPSFNENDAFGKASYDQSRKEIGLYAANELFRLFSEEKTNASLRQMTKTLIPCIESNDYTELVNAFYPSAGAAILNESPFNQEPFFLSDSQKAILKNKFLERLSDFNFGESSQERFLARILSVFIKEFTQEEKNQIIEHIVQTVPAERSTDYLWMLFSDPEDNSKLLNSFHAALDKHFLKISKMERLNFLERMLEKRDYTALTNFLFQNKHLPLLEKEAIGQQFASMGFLLPDLSETINYASWEYCHEIASFIADMPALCEAFIKELDNQCANSKSISLRQRCNILTAKISKRT